MLGKLKKTLKERCPDCGKVLQLRAIGEYTMIEGDEVSIDYEYLCCSNINCGYERSVEKRRFRRKEEV